MITLVTGVLTLSGLLTLCWSLGGLLCPASEREENNLWLGLLALVALVSLVQLVFPVGDLLARSLIMATGLLGLARRRDAFRHLRALRVKAAATSAVAFLGILVVVTLLSVRPITNPDSGLYHFQALEFLRTERMIVGLSNLQIRLAHPSSAYSIAAIAENGLWGSEGYRLTAGLVTTLSCISFGVAYRRFRNLSGGASDALLLFALPCVWGMLIFDPAYFAGVSLDGTTAIVGVVAASYLLRFLELRDNKSFGDAALLAALAYSFRPASAWFVLVLIGLGATSWRAGLISVRPTLIPAFFIGLFVFRTWLLSGVPIFPLGVATPWTSWALSSDALDNYLGEVASSASGSAEPLWTDVSLVWSWYRNLRLHLDEVFVVGLLTLGLVPTLWRQRSAFSETARAVLLVALVPVVIWFVFGPDFRFGMAPLATLAASPVMFLAFSSSDSRNNETAGLLVRWSAMAVVLLTLLVPALGPTGTILFNAVKSPSAAPASETAAVLEASRSGSETISAPLGEESFCGRQVWCVPSSARADQVVVRQFLLWKVVTDRSR